MSKLKSDYTIIFLVINHSKQDPTYVYLDKILLTNIYLITIKHSLLLMRDHILGSENNLPSL